MEKSIYLTIDDGCGPNTDNILDILKEKGIKATFFVIGQSLKAYEKDLKRLDTEGHAIGVHSWNHLQKELYPDDHEEENFMAQMYRCNDEIERITQKRTQLMRAPFGSVPGIKQNYLDKIYENGYALWDWNVDSLDWKFPNDPNKIKDNIYKGVAAVKRPIVLMHEKNVSVKILPSIIQHYLDAGYKFEVLSLNIAPLNFRHDTRIYDSSHPN